MIKLVQGFDIGSPLPIDGRITLSINEMKEISDNLLPERYFAINRDDGRLYLYNKQNAYCDSQETDQKRWFGRFRLADEILTKFILGENWPDYVDQNGNPKGEIAEHGGMYEAVNDRVDSEVETINNRIDDEVDILDKKIDSEGKAINDRIDNEVEELNYKIDSEGIIINNRITNEVQVLNDSIGTVNRESQNRDADLDRKIDSYEDDHNLINGTELSEALLDYALGDEAGNSVRLSIDDNFKLKLQLLNKDGDLLEPEQIVDLPLEEMVIDADYDEERQVIILHVKGPKDSEGEPQIKDIEIPLGALVSDLVSIEAFNAHTSNEVIHVTQADKNKWNNVVEGAVTVEDLHEYLAGDNAYTFIETNPESHVSTFKTLEYKAGQGITISRDSGDYDSNVRFISTDAAAPYWKAIQGRAVTGDGPMENEEFANVINTLDATKVDNTTFLNFQTDEYEPFKSSISSRMSTAEQNIRNNSTSIGSEISARQSADNTLTGRIAAEEATRESAVTTLTTNLNSEISRATGEENTIKANLTSEITRAQGAETANANAISAEVTRAEGVEEDLDTRLTEVESDTNKVVMTSLNAFVQEPDKIIITNNNVNIKTGTTSSTSHHLPLADINNAGLMSPTDVSSIANLQDRVQSLEGRTKRYLYNIKTDPTPSEINAFAISLGLSAPFEGVAIVVDQTYHIWHYYQNTAAWKDDGPDVVHIFNNETPGVILGTAVDGKIYAEGNGIGSVYGWDTLKESITDLTTDKADRSWVDDQLATKVDKVSGSGLIETTEKTRLTNIASGAQKIEDEVEGDGLLILTKRVNGVDSQEPLNVYTHPVGSAASKESGFYKFSTDETSHIGSVTNVGVSDITGLAPYNAGVGLSSSTSSGKVTFNQTYTTVSVDTSWTSESSYFKKNVSVSGVTANSNPVLDIVISASQVGSVDSLLEAWSKIYSASSYAGGITLYAKEKPAVSFTMSVKGY